MDDEFDELFELELLDELDELLEFEFEEEFEDELEEEFEERFELELLERPRESPPRPRSRFDTDFFLPSKACLRKLLTGLSSATAGAAGNVPAIRAVVRIAMIFFMVSFSFCGSSDTVLLPGKRDG